MLQKRFELCLVVSLGVGLVGIDPSFFQKVHYGVVQKGHPEFLAPLHVGDYLMGLPLADQVPNRGGCEQNFKSGTPAVLIDSFEQHLGDNRLEPIGQSAANLGLLAGRKHLDHTIYGFRRAGGVKGPENQVAG